MLIELAGIVKDYGTMRALDSVDLQIPRGITGLLGPNGAGKSTLIKLILGLVRVNAGNGSVLGHPLATEGKQIRDRVGYMPEDDCYLPGMSGVQVVQFSACLAGLPRVEALRRSHEILDFCDMKQERYRNIETFSTGMRQKVKFAASIVHDPDLLILDEPTSGLDPEERESMLNRIRILARQAGKSVLISTHILPDVQAICDTVVILSRGRVVMNRSLAELNQRTSPTVTIQFLGDGEVFQREVAEKGLEARLTPNGQLEVEAEDSAQLRPVWDVAARLGIPIRSLLPAKNSLEEIFIRTVEEAQDAPA